MHCPECGEEIPENNNFCSECGAEISADEATVTEENTKLNEDNNPQPDRSDENGVLAGFSWKMGVTATALGLLIGGFAAWATANIGSSSIAFVIAFPAATYYLYQKPIPSAAIGSGLYITSLVAVLTPIVFYLPTVVGDQPEGLEGAGTFIGGLVGLVIWGFVFAIVSVVIAAVGYFFNKRANNKLSE
jgi:hypothetical protein